MNVIKQYSTGGYIYIIEDTEFFRDVFHKNIINFLKAFGAKGANHNITKSTGTNEKGVITYNSEIGYKFCGTARQCSYFHNALVNFTSCFHLQLRDYTLSLTELNT